MLNELVTGPCKRNQEIVMTNRRAQDEDPSVRSSLYLILKIMNRVVDDLEDEFLDIKHSCLIYVLSLCEDNEPKILEYFSGKMNSLAFMTQIQRMLKKVYIGKLIKDKQFDSKVKEYEAKKEKENKKKKKDYVIEEIPDNEPKKAQQVNQVMPRKSFMGLGMDSTMSMDKINEPNPDTFITQEMEVQVFISHWKILFEMYIEDPDFSEGVVFDFIFRLLILWENISNVSKRHKTRLAEVKSDAKSFFNKGSDITKGDDTMTELYAIFYFIEKITIQIELRVKDGKNINLFFPK